MCDGGMVALVAERGRENNGAFVTSAPPGFLIVRKIGKHDRCPVKMAFDGALYEVYTTIVCPDIAVTRDFCARINSTRVDVGREKWRVIEITAQRRPTPPDVARQVGIIS